MFDFRNCFSGQVGNTALCLKRYNKIERHLFLVRNSFNKLSKNVRLMSDMTVSYGKTYDFVAFCFSLLLRSRLKVYHILLN